MTRPMLLITMLSLSLTAQTLPLLEPDKWAPHKDGGAAPTYQKLDDGSVRFSVDMQIVEHAVPCGDDVVPFAGFQRHGA